MAGCRRLSYISTVVCERDAQVLEAVQTDIVRDDGGEESCEL